MPCFGKSMIVREYWSVNETGELGSPILLPPKKWACLAGFNPGDEAVIAAGFVNLLLVAPSGKDRETDQPVEAAGDRA